MRVSKTGLKTFKELYAARFGKDLNEADALRKAQALLEIFEAIYGDPLAIDQEVIELQTNKQNEDSGSSENKKVAEGNY